MTEESVGAEGGGSSEKTPERRSGATSARMALLRLISGSRFPKKLTLPEGKPARVKARVPLRVRGKYIVLSLDTERDRLVASCTNALGCNPDMYSKTEYYAHTDQSGKSHFYKTGSKVPWEITPAMEKWMDAFRWGAGPEDGPAMPGPEMPSGPRARAVAERLCGIKFMSRRALLRDLTYLERHDQIEILDDVLREEHGSKPTSRYLGSLSPSQSSLLLRDRGGAVLETLLRRQAHPSRGPAVRGGESPPQLVRGLAPPGRGQVRVRQAASCREAPSSVK